MAHERKWDVRLLGPLAVLKNDSEVDLGGRMQRRLLALLLLRRGEVVSVDRLVDDLWESAPPPGAAKTLQVYVSRLRGVLGADAVAHEGGGYVIRLPPDAVDVDRFEQLYEEGHDLRARGESGAAAERLRAALALWRGEPLAVLANSTFALAEIARLDELRLAALEERIDANLDLGRQAALVPELERLVREHPTRERLRRQLMLALYRSGRQADALESYRQGRDAMRDELGLELGPELQELERAILNQEPELRAPAPRVARPRPTRRGGVLATVGGLIIVAAAAAALAIARESGRTAGLASAAPDSLAEIDPRSNTLVAELPIGSAPIAVAVGAQSVWVANAGDQTLTRVDPATRSVMSRTGLGRIPSQLAFGGGGLWVASSVGRRGVVQQVEPAGASVVSTRTMRVGAGQGDDVFAPPTPSALATGAGSVWANSLQSNLARFDSAKPGVVTRALHASRSVDGIAVGEGSVWVASGVNDRVLRLDPRTGRVVAEIPIAAAPDARVASPYGIAVGYGSVWVTDALSNSVSEIDPKLNAVTATIPVGTRPTRITAGEQAVWIVNAGDSTVTRIDPARHAAVATINVGPALTGIAAGLGGVWVTVAGQAPADTSSRVAAPVRALPRSSCSPVVHSSGTPEVLIASELPTYLDQLEPDAGVTDMRAGILRVLHGHGFRAGRYRVGYQACDDSSPGGGPSPERCAANARSYAADASLVGILGTYTSGCAQIELPVLNAAPGGPVPMISPSNTYVGLTHAGPATASDEPDRYSPTGSRSYVHLLGADDTQSAAIATFLHEQGRKRVYVLDDGQGTGFAGATYFARAADKLRLPIVGHSTWRMNALDYRALARRIKRAGADAVVLSGCACANGLQLLTDLRAELGPNPVVIGTDNFTDSSDMFRTTFGPLGLMIAGAGRALASVGGGAAYAAEATNVLLDAIARSDGTRASITRALFATRFRDSPVGRIAFDASGDPTPAPITIYRVDATAPPGRRSPAGAVPVHTYEPAADLAR